MAKRVFVWRDLDHVTCNYHPKGGLLVVAESVEQAYELAEKDPSIKIGGAAPDRVFVVDDLTENEVIVFPNAGCC